MILHLKACERCAHNTGGVAEYAKLTILKYNKQEDQISLGKLTIDSSTTTTTVQCKIQYKQESKTVHTVFTAYLLFAQTDRIANDYDLNYKYSGSFGNSDMQDQ